ncbi:MAG: hypothetical protein VYE77_01160 [Planctomycetota bacterium]|nr:hypothetical protein [Planctomycetota bacterium]
MNIHSLAALLPALLFLPAAGAQNLLTNPGFESGLVGWTPYGPNIYAETNNPAGGIVPHTGTVLCKMYGQFIGGSNFNGAFQSFTASPGEVFTMDCWTRHSALDPLQGVGQPNDNYATMRIAFFDAGNQEIGAAERVVLDGNFPQNTWIDNPPVSGTAPAGTVRVEAHIQFIQPGVGTGSTHFDDVLFTRPSTTPGTYPGSGEDLLLATGIGGVAPTSGATNDIKTATTGDLLELNVSSPGGAYSLSAYYLVGQLFTTGAPPTPLASFPDLWFGFTTFFLLVDGSSVPIIGAPLIGPNGGTSSFFITPPGLAGSSVMIQGLVINSSTTNGLYAATDGHEIRFQ